MERKEFLQYFLLGSLSAVATGCNQESGIDTKPKLDEWDTNINTLWTMKTVFNDSVRSSILYQAPQMVCDLVLEISGGEFGIELERSGEAEEILEEVSEGKIECGYSGVYYSSSKYRSLFFSNAIPYIFKAACYQTHMKIKNEYQQKNSEALAALSQGNTKFMKFSDEILAAAKQKTEELLKIDAEQDEVFKEVYEEWTRFKNKIRKWSELTYYPNS